MRGEVWGQIHLISIIEGLSKYASSVSEVKMIEERERERLAAVHHAADVKAAHHSLELHSEILRGLSLLETGRRSERVLNIFTGRSLTYSCRNHRRGRNRISR
jgi:hypothetical protein